MKYELTLLENAEIEVIDGDRGKNYPHQSELQDNGFCLFLSAKNVTKTGFVFDETQYISKEKDELLNNGKLGRGDIVITTRGTIGNVALYSAKVSYDNIRINSGMLIIRCGKNISNQYLYQALRSDWFQRQIMAVQSGSAQPQLPKSHFLKMSIPLPILSIQQKIANVLQALDDKIELNSAINNNLSVLLQAIYQKLFGDVSLGANQGILSDICSYSKEKVAVSELNVNTYFSTENMLPEKAGSIKATSLPTTPQTTACRKGDTLISNIRPYFKKIVYCEDMCGCSTDVLCFTPVQSQYAAYLFSTLYNDKFFAFMVAGSKGTKMPRGDKQQIMTYPVVLPAESELEEFNAIAFPVLEQLNSNRTENKRLSALRDALLPKLMSGELDVSKIDI